MAGLATDIWEFRATAGDANAGGGFDTASGGTDFSDQDSAQLQLTDLVTGGIGSTALSSVVGGFTAAMIGNYIQIRSGTNVVAGFYRVTAHTDTNNVTIDRAADDGVGGISGGAGDLGGALDVFLDSFFDNVNTFIAGNTVHVKNDGTMTLTENIAVIVDGVKLLKIRIEGYNTTRGDQPKGANRPAIACGSNTFNFDFMWQIENLILTGTAVSVLSVTRSSIVKNVKSTNSSGTSNRRAIRMDSTRIVILACEAISTNGEGIAVDQGSATIISCYLHDSVDGINHVGESTIHVTNCIFDTNTAGIKGSNNDGLVVTGCTFYNNTDGIKDGGSGDVEGYAFFNNIFDANTTGINIGDASDIFMDNNLYDNTTDVTGTRKGKGPNSVTGDPGLTDPANGDFTLGSGSNAINAALQVGTDVGAVGDYKTNIGVDQDDVSAGGAGIGSPRGLRGGLH